MIIPNGSRPLETERLILRPFRESDGESMFKNWASDPMVTRYVTWEPHTDVSNTRALCKMWEDESKDPKSFRWAIVLKETGEPVGSIDIVALHEDELKGEIGYCSGQVCWGKGIMTEAFKAVMTYLFGECGFESISGRYDVRNPASGRVMEKCGMRYTHDEPFKGKNGYEGTVSCRVITREEWEAQQ